MDRARIALASCIGRRLVEVCAAASWSIFPTLAPAALAAAGSSAKGDIVPCLDDVDGPISGDRRVGAPLLGRFVPIAKITDPRLIAPRD